MCHRIISSNFNEQILADGKMHNLYIENNEGTEYGPDEVPDPNMLCYFSEYNRAECMSSKNYLKTFIWTDMLKSEDPEIKKYVEYYINKKVLPKLNLVYFCKSDQISEKLNIYLKYSCQVIYDGIHHGFDWVLSNDLDINNYNQTSRRRAKVIKRVIKKNLNIFRENEKLFKKI
jgi:hypothetical protein